MQRRPGGQTGPSVILCPNCRAPKDSNRATCSNCNTRACPTGHIMSPSARICSQCNWVDRYWKAQSTLHPSNRGPETMPETSNACPLCNSKIDKGTSKCPYCGYIISSEFVFTQNVVAPPPTHHPAAPRVETYTVTQESMGHHDKKRTYLCPNCNNKVDNPRAGKCPYCGYVGGFQYELTQHQPPWASPPTPPTRTMPPRQQMNYPQQTVDYQKQQPPAHSAPPITDYYPQLQPEYSKPAGEHNCPSCGSPNPIDSRFCQTCGTRYGSGRVSHQLRTQSTSEWSANAASSTPAILQPIYGGSGAGASTVTDITVVRERKIAGGKKKGKVREEHEEKHFPLGLLMSIMIVTAMIAALAIFVLSKMNAPTTTIVSITPTPLQISEVVVDLNTSKAAVIKWITDRPATSFAALCDKETNMCLASDPDDTTLVTSHTFTIGNVTPNITYHLSIKSVAADGVEAVIEKDITPGATGIVVSPPTTPTPTSVPPPTDNITDKTIPKITEVNHGEPVDIGAIIKWKTDEPATSQVDFGTTQNFGTSTPLDSLLTTNHTVILTGLSPDTQYYYRISSRDAAGNLATDNTASYIFRTRWQIANGTTEGTRARAFTLKDLNNNNVNITDFIGKKIVMINFWATWCGPCLEEMPYIQSVYAGWAGNQKLEVLAIDFKENSTLVGAFIQMKSYTFPVLLDTNGAVAGQYNVTNYPTTYFLDIFGIIKKVQVGNFSSADAIKNILDTL